MHGTFASELDVGGTFWRTPAAPHRVNATAAAIVSPQERAVYGARKPNWPLIAFIIALHGFALAGLMMFDVIPISKPKPAPIVVTLIKMPVEPPPQKPEDQPAKAEEVKPHVTAPAQIVQIAAPVLSITVPRTPPQPPVIAPPAPSGPVAIDDLGSKMVAMTPPRYPMESRRRKEQGTVVLSVLLGADGGVTELTLAHSSGFDRLDKAALEAVRKWRWSPTIRGGEPVMVRGTVDIPFILKA